MRAFDELRKLEMFFKEEAPRGCSIIDLYELVQHAKLSYNASGLLYQTIEALLNVPAPPELALRLYLQCGEDSKAQVTATHLIIRTLQRMRVFGVENRDTSTHKATGYSAKLLKKPDQCRAVYACSHLFWVDDQENMKDGERVLICLESFKDCKCCPADVQCNTW